MNITLKLRGTKKLNTYLSRLFSFLRDLPEPRRNSLIERFQTIDDLVVINDDPAKRAGAFFVSIKPSKHLLKFATAAGAGHLNRRWNNTFHR